MYVYIYICTYCVYVWYMCVNICKHDRERERDYYTTHTYTVHLYKVGLGSGLCAAEIKPANVMYLKWTYPLTSAQLHCGDLVPVLAVTVEPLGEWPVCMSCH